MFYYRVTHKYMLFDHIEKKDIGIYSSLENANNAIKVLELKEGFIDTKEGFSIKKVFKLIKPKLLDKTLWEEGFDTYVWVENINKKITCDETYSIMEHFSFLVKEYNFKFDKIALGDMRDENGKLWFYGPFNCYSFYNENVCINFMNLVQRQDWYITITKELSNDQTYIRKGQKIGNEYEYNWELLASVIKNDIKQFKTIFGNSIDRE